MVLDKATSSSTANEVPFTGRVVFVEIEGGFWGIITDSGRKLDGGIPSNLRVNNQKISGIYRVKKDIASFRMWGDVVELSQLEPIGPIIKSLPNEF